MIKRFPRTCRSIWFLDNSATHKTPKVAAWLKKRSRYHLHFTPTSASWLNQVERWLAKLTDQKLRQSAFRAVKELEQAIHDYIEQNHANPKPFIWTASADLILERFRMFVNGLITQNTSLAVSF